MLLSEATTAGFFFLAPWIVFFPVIGLLLNIIIGGRLSEKGIGWLASGASFASFVVSVLLAYSVWAGHGEGESVFLAPWIHIVSTRSRLL
jgi:NADH-quinone oxidoreductase subunit L